MAENEGITVKEIMAYFDTKERPMTAREMIREWKPMSDADKAQIKKGLIDGSFTY